MGDGMIDPRESKLPKWVQETLKCERSAGLITPPPFERPEPDYTQRNGHSLSGERLEMRWVHGIHGWDGHFMVHKKFAGKNGTLYDNEKCKGIGSRGDGDFWFSKDAARKEIAWRAADHCAERLYEAYLLAGVWA